MQTEAPRNLFGWVAMWTIILGLVALGLASYFERDSDKGISDSKLDGSLKLALTERKLRQHESFEELAAALAPKRNDDPKAMRYFAVVRFEQGKPLQTEDIKKLETSSEKFDKALAKIYSATTLTKTEADKLENDLEGGSFLADVAAAHAKDRAGDNTARLKLIPDSKVEAAGVVSTIFAIIMAAGIAFWIYYFNKKPQPVGIPLKWISLADADHLALRAAILLFGYIGVGVLISSVRLPETIDGPVAGLAMAVLAIVMLKFRLPSDPVDAAKMGITFDGLGRKMKWAVWGAVANAPVLVFAVAVGLGLFSNLPQAEHPLSTQLANDSSLPAVMIAVVLASICAPIFEEILFRGHIFPALARVTNSIPIAIAVSSLAFAAMHPTGIPAWPPLVAIGAMGCWLTVQTGSLVPSIAMHAIHNLAILCLAIAIG